MGVREGMGGVDLGDQLRLGKWSLELSFITNKAWVRIFTGLLSMIMTNLYIVYRYYYLNVERLEFLISL